MLHILPTCLLFFCKPPVFLFFHVCRLSQM
jgi:hypothetical protein